MYTFFIVFIGTCTCQNKQLQKHTIFYSNFNHDTTSTTILQNQLSQNQTLPSSYRHYKITSNLLNINATLGSTFFRVVEISGEIFLGREGRVDFSPLKFFDRNFESKCCPKFRDVTNTDFDFFEYRIRILFSIRMPP